jgi:hydrogenase expression/formation protein HypE
VALVPAEESDRALHLMGAGAVQIGMVEEVASGRVLLKSHIGATRIVDMLNGEQLPRIC